jgi:hypothetical protein
MVGVTFAVIASTSLGRAKAPPGGMDGRYQVTEGQQMLHYF